MSTRAQHQPVRLTKTYVDALKPPLKNQSFIRDGELKGFGVRVTANGAKAFILEKRINGRVRRQTIGRYPDLTVEQARKQAQVLLGQIAQGIDPVAEKEAARARQINLADAFADFKRARKGLKLRTLYDYERVMAVAFPDWQTRPLLEISKEMVQRRHAKLGTDRGPAYANLAMRFLRSLFNFALERYEDRQGRSVLHENPVDRLTRTRAWYRVQRRRTVIKAHELPAWYRGVSALRAGTGAGPARNRNGKGAVTGAGPVTEPLPARSGPEASGQDIADYLELLLFTGLRRQEAATLTWDQVDLKERSLTIPDPKNHEPLVLPLSDYVYALLSRRREHAWAKSPYVFPGTGKQGHLVEPKRAINKVKAVEATGSALRYVESRNVGDAEAALLDKVMTGLQVTAPFYVRDVWPADRAHIRAQLRPIPQECRRHILADYTEAYLAQGRQRANLSLLEAREALGDLPFSLTADDDAIRAKAEAASAECGRLIARSGVSAGVGFCLSRGVEPPPTGSPALDRAATARMRDSHWWRQKLRKALSHLIETAAQRFNLVNENSLLKLLYAGILKASERWTHPVQNWNLTLSQLTIHFPDRLDSHISL